MRNTAMWLWLLVIVAGCLVEAPPESQPRILEFAEPTTQKPAASEPVANAEVAANAEPQAPDAAPPALESPSTGGHNTLTRKELEAGWIRLFDGHTLFGWLPNSETKWSVNNGVIVGENGDAKGLLVTTTRFANYELRCDFRLEKNGNSGIFLRTPLKPTNPAVDCYELNMWDAAPEFKTASLVGRAKPAEPVPLDEEWHSYSMTLDGPHVTVTLDGKPVLDYTDNTAAPLASGFIGLQMNGGRAEFRNVFLRPLGLANLFDGETLTGWRVVPGSKSQFAVEDGAIHVTNGAGFLETERTAGDFVFQFEARTNGDSLNSGVFFRAAPGNQAAPSNGYEFQVHNGFKNGDRQQPVDSGTGAIFRRVAARRVITNDREWLNATLIADGPHISSWVDGVQMVDWTDTREPDENPRKGLRLAPGHFSLQGHDPTTDLAFRKIRLADLPAK
jgi:hypothetical protein